MNKVKYIFKRLKNMNFKEFFYTLNRIHKKTNKNFFILFCDMIYCGFKYMAGYVDYEQLEFYNLNKNQRKTIITRGINNNFVKELNDINYFKYIDNKILFNENYNIFLCRKWIDLRYILDGIFQFVIEGNPFPGHDVYQSKISLQNNKIGMLPIFKEIIIS